MAPLFDEDPVAVAPSILAADFGELAAAVRSVAGATNWLHIDVMDGHFVNNITLGPPVVASLRRHSSAYFDCHLMITNPGEYLEAFRRAGADLTTVHVEVGDTAAHLAEMRRLGLRAGLALNPETPLEAVLPFLSEIDLLLCMTVHPGFGGQAFIATVLDKVRRARAELLARNLNVAIEVDGGIGADNAAGCAHAGARVFVAGSSVFGAERPALAVEEIRAAALGALDSPNGGEARA